MRETFLLLFLVGGAGSRRPAAVKGAPFSRRGVSEPLTARTAVKASSREEKAARLMERNCQPLRRKQMTSKNHSPRSTVEIPKLSEGQLEPLFRRLNLAPTRSPYHDLWDPARTETWAYGDFFRAP